MTTVADALSALRDRRSSFSWDEEVLDQTIKDMLVDRAINTLRHYWSETGGDLYGRWMEKFSKRQNLGDDVIFRMGWSRFLLKLMREDPEEAVVVRMAKKDSKQVLEKRRQNSERPPTLSPWRHTVEQLSADWEAEEEEEMKVSLDHPPQLKAVSSSVVIQPVEIAKKIMDVRETLASEWREDLLNIELENKEIAQVVSEKVVLGEEKAERNRRLTNDLGDTFGGDSSPYRSENYEALVNYVTEIGAIAVQEKMRQNGDSMGWNWMEQFLYWTKANARSGSVGTEAAGDPPVSPTVGIGSVDEGRGARSKTVTATFGEGVAGGGMYETEAEKKMRCELVCVVIQLKINAQPGPVNLIFQCYSNGSALRRGKGNTPSQRTLLPSFFPLLFHDCIECVKVAVGCFRRGLGAYSIVACLSRMTIDHASLSRRRERE